MKIELKNIKHMAANSEETHCYNASLYVDGKKIGVVSNYGHGGPDMFQGDREAYDTADNWLKENTPPIDVGDSSVANDIEIHCADLVNNWLTERELKNKMRNRVLYVQKDKSGIYQISWKGLRKLESRHFEYVAKQHPDATILNTLPFKEALDIWAKNMN